MKKKNKGEDESVQKAVGNFLNKNQSKIHNEADTKIIPKGIKKVDNLIKKTKCSTTIKNDSQTNIPKDNRTNVSSIKMKGSATIKEEQQTNIDSLQKIYGNSVRVTKQVKIYKQKNVEISRLSSLNQNTNKRANMAAVNLKVLEFPLQSPKSNKDIMKSSKAFNSKRWNTHKEKKIKGKTCHQRKRVSLWRDHSRNSDVANKLEDIVRSTKLNLTASLITLLQDGQLKFAASSVNAKLTVKAYLNKHPLIIIQLIRIAHDCSSWEVYSNAVALLHQILVKSGLFSGNRSLNILTYLKSPQNLMKLVNNVHTTKKRFRDSRKFKMKAPFLYIRVFEIVVVASQVGECRKQLETISTDAVTFMCTLLAEQDNTELLLNTLKVFKIICVSKRTCHRVSSKLFYDGLCRSYKKTQRSVLIVAILKLMAQSKMTTQHMSVHCQTVDLLLAFLNYQNMALLRKNVYIIVTILHKIAMTEYGLKIISHPVNYTIMYNFFLRNKDSEEIGARMKIYSILKRCTTKIVLPLSKLEMDLDLSNDILRCVQEERDGSYSCHEADEDFSDSEDTNSSLSNSQKIMTEQRSSRESLKEMKIFFREILQSNKTFAPTNLNMFNTTRQIGQDLIGQRVCMVNNLRLAFPDAAMVIPQCADSISTTSKFPLKYLLSKLNVGFSCTEPRVVYNLDELCKTQEPADIPSAITFMPRQPSGKEDVGLLKFESRFDCGNLRRATQIEKFEYDLILNPDTYTCRGYQWFYFQISNMTSQEMYTFNIINLTETNNLFNDGMRPVMFSITDYKLKGIGWKRAGERVVYYGNHYTNRSGTLQYKTLSFCIEFPHACDYVYIAYHYPYTYTRLMVGLALFVNYKSSSIYARLDKLCGTINNNNEVPLLTITASLDSPKSLKIPLQVRPIIFISARVRPGESNASWIMEGIINHLLSETEPLATTAREHYIFKIIPMLNPEGVIYGNSRLSLVGLDLNRCWSKPSKLLSPEIYYTKRLIEYAKREIRQPIAAFIDIHGHSTKRCFFLYGCNPQQSWNSKDHIKGDFTRSLKILPQTIHKLNPNIQLSNCKYDISKSKETSGRVVMWREFGITQSYTLECTYSEGSRKQTMNDKTLTEIGASVVAALGKIADTAYKCKRSITNYGLDYSNMDKRKSKKAKVKFPTANILHDTLR